eukprot:1361330-Amorphochlora_amoeboformis.AAC.1
MFSRVPTRLSSETFIPNGVVLRLMLEIAVDGYNERTLPVCGPLRTVRRPGILQCPGWLKGLMVGKALLSIRTHPDPID